MHDTLPDSTQISAESLGIVVAPTGPDGSDASSAGAPSPPQSGEAPDAEGRKRGHGIVFSGAWEQELIISGAVVFALMQVPSAVDGQFRHLEPHLAGGTFMLALMAFQYVKLILYTLIATFVVHLTTRAYWVGLIGLHSVFPGGVREEELRQGPVTAEVYRRLTPTLPRAIAVTDDFCSTIFSFSFMMVAAFLVSTVWCVLMAGITWAVSRALFGGVWQNGLFWGGFAVFGFAPALLTLVDRTLGARLAQGGAPRRLLKGAITVFYHVYALKAWAPITRVLFSNVPRRKAYSGFYAALALLVVFFLATDILSRAGVSAVDGSRFAPAEDDARGVSAMVYEDQRPDGEVYALTPSIPSDVVQGPYVRLFIPYTPRRHDAVVPERCPGVKPLGEAAASPADADVNALLACLARIQPVTLNGRPLTAPFRFRTDPRSDVRGIVAYVPTQGLPRGENVITVARAPRPRADDLLVKRRDQPPYVIRFWL
jgi:hypothetical protein